jgi:hypothetical protein
LAALLPPGDGAVLLAVATDGFYRASSQGFVAEGLFLVVLRLFEEVGVAAVVVTGEVGGCGLTAEVAVDALIIYVVSAGGILRVFVFEVSHGDGFSIG